MKTLLSLIVSLLICSILAGCLEKPKPQVKIKRVYIKTKVPKAPPECRATAQKLKPLPRNTGLTEMTQEQILLRAKYVKVNADFDVCKTYTRKISGK